MSFVLMGRDSKALESVKLQLNELGNDIIGVICGDLIDNKTLVQFEQICSSSAEDYNHVILFNNAGTLGPVDKLTKDFSQTDSTLLVNYFEENLFSIMKMTARFIKLTENIPHIKKRWIINTSSLTAIEPFQGMSLYCTGN